MSVTVKKVGCANLKQIVEDDNSSSMTVSDNETTTFIQKKQSWLMKDFMMTSNVYSNLWLVQQDYFKEMTDNDVRKRIDEQRNQIEQDMAPFGFITTGLEGDEGFVEEGSVWEYGDTQEDVEHMWSI